MPKTRMQIMLDPKSKKMLEIEANSRGISVAQVIREAVELYGMKKNADDKVLTDDDPLWDIVGIIGKGTDLSEEHDHYLYGSPKRKQRKK